MHVIAKTPTGIGRQAKIIDHSDLFRVQLYNTIVYLETPTRIELDNGGWLTPTTVRYMNQALNHREVMAHVTIKNGEMLCNGQPFTASKYILTKATK